MVNKIIFNIIFKITLLILKIFNNCSHSNKAKNIMTLVIKKNRSDLEKKINQKKQGNKTLKVNNLALSIDSIL